MNDDKENKKEHGGKRPGAGRKVGSKTAPEKRTDRTERLHYRLTPYELEKLKEHLEKIRKEKNT